MLRWTMPPNELISDEQLTQYVMQMDRLMRLSEQYRDSVKLLELLDVTFANMRSLNSTKVSVLQVFECFLALFTLDGMVADYNRLTKSLEIIAVPCARRCLSTALSAMMAETEKATSGRTSRISCVNYTLVVSCFTV
jgi:hypothetical protein